MLSLLEGNEKTSKSGWWFGTFFTFPYIGNNHPNWLSCFSEGFKPPTRNNPKSIACLISTQVPQRQFWRSRVDGVSRRPIRRKLGVQQGLPWNRSRLKQHLAWRAGRSQKWMITFQGNAYLGGHFKVCMCSSSAPQCGVTWGWSSLLWQSAADRNVNLLSIRHSDVTLAPTISHCQPCGVEIKHCSKMSLGSLRSRWVCLKIVYP